MFQETLIQNSPFKGQAIDLNTNKVVDISDFVGEFDVIEDGHDGIIKQWTSITITRQNKHMRSFQINANADAKGSVKLLLKEYSEAECGIGAGCWLSSIAMLSWLSDNYLNYSTPARVLEVGCGVALNSLYLASSQSQVNTSIVASDHMHTIGYAFDENKALNGIDTSKVAYEVLDWNQCISETYNPSTTIGTFDLIMATDCIYKSTATMFFNVIKHHLAKNGRLLLINPMEKSRPGTDNFIYKLAEMGEISISHIAIQLNKKYTKPLIFVEFTA